MSASSRLLARLLPLALPLTFACGAKSELLAEDPDETAAGRAGTGGSAGRASSGGASNGGSTSSAGSGGGVSQTGGGGGTGPIATAGSGGGSPVDDLPPCSFGGPGCQTVCYAGAPDETCLPSFPEEPVQERFRCAAQIWGETFPPGLKPGECCYLVGTCGGGRPLLADGEPRVASLQRGAGWQ